MTRNGAMFSGIDPEIDQLLHPSHFYARPSDVVADQLLTVDERRAILSSWASDACAVESNPALRQPPHAIMPVTFDEIMDALLQLDRLKDSSMRCQMGASGLMSAECPAGAVQGRFCKGSPLGSFNDAEAVLLPAVKTAS